MTETRRDVWSARLQRVFFELSIVFVGVLAALWVDSSKERGDQRERALRIAEAMSAEITHVDKWYQPWRDTIRLHYSDWQRRVEGGEQPPPYFFRMPGAEHAPTVGWQVSLDSNILGVFEPSLVFAIGNTYHEWEDIGDRLARYHSATEQLIYPLLGNDLIGVAEYGVDTHRHWSDKLVQLQVPAAYATRGNLHREYAANLSLMEDVLTQLDSRFADAGRLKARLDSTIASLRPR